MTHTVASLAVSAGAHTEIAAALRSAGYDHAFIEDGLIDMSGIGLAVEPMSTAKTGAGPVIQLNAIQLRSALEFVAPDFDTDEPQREEEVVLQRLPARTSDEGEPMEAGLYCWLAEYPEEGCIPLREDESFPAATPAAPGAAQMGLATAARRLEEACNKRAALLTREAYLAAEAIPGMRDVLDELDSARKDVRVALAQPAPVQQEPDRALGSLQAACAGLEAAGGHLGALVDELHGLLDLSYNGLKWYRDAHPEDDSGADDELYERIDAALAKLAPVPQGAPVRSLTGDATMLQGVDALLREAYAHWDADREYKVGKILLALIGHSKGYDKRSDAFRAAISNQQPVEGGA